MIDRTLFILEEPYISDFMLETLEKNKIPVLNNGVTQKYPYYNLNIISKEEALKNYEGGRIYSNSENSADLVINTFPQSETTRLIKLCKNKYIFREQLKYMYPDFYFDKITTENIDFVSNLPSEFIIKPSVGFLSMGVHKVKSKEDWTKAKKKIKEEIKNFKNNFPLGVINPEEFIIEEIIKGEEYAIDAYFNEKGDPVILNIFKHPFVSEKDVSDRAYITSKDIILENIIPFEMLLSNIGKALNIKDFAIHIEVIKKSDNTIIPIEINPMRFAGWCTTDLAYYAYGINIYEYFFKKKKPNWNEILQNKGDEIYYFAMAETPKDIDKNSIKFDYEKLKKSFSNILNFRKIDFLKKPMFGIIFGMTTEKNEIKEILELNMKDFIF